MAHQSPRVVTYVRYEGNLHLVVQEKMPGEVLQRDVIT